MTSPSDPLARLRTRSYLELLALAAIIGVPVSAAAYFFLALVSKGQAWVFTDMPRGLGFHSEPLWWPVPPLLLAGGLVSLTIRYLPGTGGHSPADGFKAGGGAPAPTELIGSGAGSTSEPQSGRSARTRGAADRARRRDAGARARPWPARSGSRLADVHRAQILDRTRYVLASHPHLPAAARPDIAQFGWVLAIGLLAATLGCGIRWLGPFITHAASYTAGAWCC